MLKFLSLSAEEKLGINELKSFLKGKNLFLQGPLVWENLHFSMPLILNLRYPTQETREKAKGRGRHTTVMSTFHYLEDDDLYIIDTPGFREFNLMEISKRRS